MECPPLYLRRDVKQGEKGIMLEMLKDIFYDKNDIILALIIVVAAGFFITHQMDAIMSYPELMTQELQAQQEEEIPSGQETGDAETGAKPGTDVDNPDDPSGQQAPDEDRRGPHRGDSFRFSQRVHRFDPVQCRRHSQQGSLP